jgi:periplasmic protein TonB
MPGSMQTAYYPTGPRDPLGKAFFGSLATHGLAIGLVVASGLWNLTRNNFGSPRASSGSVGVSMVKTIPIPRHEGPVNPLANDTKSIVPELPLPALEKPRLQLKTPPREDAIPIPGKPKKISPREEAKALFRPPVQYKPNQVYSNTPQAANSPLYGMQGSGGIDIGPASVLGSRFGAYVDLMRDRISQRWNTANVHALPTQKCAVTFTIARNGTVSNVQVSQPSGDYLLDTSAKRAVLDANPLPALPQQFERNDATVELWFQLRQ